MANCLKCGFPITAGARFCSNCGTKVNNPQALIPCKKCMSGIAADSSFCPWCGEKNEAVQKTARTLSVSATTPNMVNVEGGAFFMGTGDLTHRVELSSFKISAAPVTQAQYKYIMGKSPSKFNGDDLPVEGVDWCDAVRYCNELSKRMNLIPCYSIGDTTDFSTTANASPLWKRIVCNFLATGFRLPTEAEWEYAARGGKKGNTFIYSGSDTIDEVAWYGENSFVRTHEVGEKKPNALGIYDMCGNVAEWIFDEYAEYIKKPQVNPSGPNAMSDLHVKRGGSWLDDPEQCSVFFRSGSPKNGKSSTLGFRVCSSIIQPAQ